jgi:hypothetical protein
VAALLNIPSIRKGRVGDIGNGCEADARRRYS